MSTEPEQPEVTILRGSGELPPSAGGLRMRLWTRDFTLIYDNAAADEPMNDALDAAFLTVERDGGRRHYVVDEMPQDNPFHRITFPETAR